MLAVGCASGADDVQGLATALKSLGIDGLFDQHDTFMEPVCQSRNPAYPIVCIFARYMDILDPSTGWVLKQFEGIEPDKSS